MAKKITREEYLELKFKSFMEMLENYLPEEAYLMEFEDIFNSIQENIC